MYRPKDAPMCGVEECFACENHYCMILNNNEFGYRMCPFFKTKEQVEKEKADWLARYTLKK